MIEQHHLQTVDHHGETAPITLQVDVDGESTTITALAGSETIHAATGVDLLDSLINLRRELEARGKLLCCHGARPDVWPSGQLRQFTDGRQGYVLTSFNAQLPDDPYEIVDLLDPAPADRVATVDEQHRFVRAFYGLPPARPTPETPVGG